MPRAGIEPARLLRSLDFKSSVSTNSTTPACTTSKNGIKFSKEQKNYTMKILRGKVKKEWRPRWDLHPRIAVLQTAALLLGYVTRLNDFIIFELFVVLEKFSYLNNFKDVRKINFSINCLGGISND